MTLISHGSQSWRLNDSHERSNPARRHKVLRAQELCSNSHCCSRHIDDILQAETVRSSGNQVVYHTGPEDVDHVIKSMCAKGEIAKFERSADTDDEEHTGKIAQNERLWGPFVTTTPSP